MKIKKKKPVIKVPNKPVIKGEPQDWYNPEVLVKLVKESGKSYYAISKEIGMSEGHVNNLISGATKDPSIRTIYRLAKFFNVPMEVFMGGH